MGETSGLKGRLVVICGIDGSGKATQTTLLASRAEAEGATVRQISFPRYGQGFFADLIQRYLRGEFAARAGDVSPYLAALPYACDRWEAAPIMRKWLEEGHLVLSNRYVPANLAHQGSKIASADDRRAFCDWAEDMEYGAFQLPRPDAHVLLDMPPELALRLIRERDRKAGREGGHDIHEKDTAHLAATALAYHEVAARDPARWAAIQCAEGGAVLAPEQIAPKVWCEVRRMLYNVSQQ